MNGAFDFLTLSRLRAGCGLLPILAIAFAGCTDGPDLGRVSGRITLDGAPLADASVMFLPDAGGRPAMAVTDREGRYELNFDGQNAGALVGRHEVKITTFRAENVEFDENDHEVVTPEQPERLPRRYHARSELTADVGPGETVCNFELQSESPD